MSKLIFGVGINDSHEPVKKKISGKKVQCKYYQTWYSMMRRCYSEKSLKRRPTYTGCYVNSAWLRFSTFKSWMKLQDWEDKNLDKDILLIGNKEYGPKTCIFVSDRINLLLGDSRAARGKYPIGVSKNPRGPKFKSQCGREYLGLYDDPGQAGLAYRNRKKEIICSVALVQNDKKLSMALLRFARSI